MEIIHKIETHLELIKVILAIIGGGFALIGSGIALWQYSKQQQFKRLQNLSAILEKFFSNDDLLTLFSLLNDANSTEVRNTSREIKLKFLVLLEEVAFYAEKFEVDKEYAVYFFQWHFHFVYTNEETYKHFWYNLVPNKDLTDDQINKNINDEINIPSWSKQYQFALVCKKKIENVQRAAAK